MTQNRFHTLDATLDKWLARRGLVALPRRALRLLVALAAMGLSLGLLLWPVTVQIFSFGVGCALAALNIYGLSRTVGNVVTERSGFGKRLFGVLSNLVRLALTALVLLLVLRLDLWLAIGLLAGFTTGIASLAFFALVFRKTLE